MIEAAFVFDNEGSIIHWHLPHGRTGGSLPDSRGLWEVMWENREILGGVAHTHPWSGQPWPSGTDVTTFSACERALGRRLAWPIITFDRVECFRWRKAVRGEEGAYTPMSVDSDDYPALSEADVEELRRLSGKKTYQADDKPLDAPFEPDWASPPGDTIQGLIEERDWSPIMVMYRLRLTINQMSDLMKGLMPVNEELAERLADVLGGSKQFWINRERQYRQDLARLARQAEAAGEDDGDVQV